MGFGSSKVDFGAQRLTVGAQKQCLTLKSFNKICQNVRKNFGCEFEFRPLQDMHHDFVGTYGEITTVIIYCLVVLLLSIFFL